MTMNTPAIHRRGLFGQVLHAVLVISLAMVVLMIAQVINCVTVNWTKAAEIEKLWSGSAANCIMYFINLNS